MREKEIKEKELRKKKNSKKGAERDREIKVQEKELRERNSRGERKRSVPMTFKDKCIWRMEWYHIQGSFEFFFLYFLYFN